jgi:hypothetical protein
MMRYESLKRRPTCFRAFTSLTVEEYDRLVARIRTDWKRARKKRLQRDDRVRKEGGGRKPELKTLEDQLLLTIIWTRMYPVYLVLEYLFGVDESTVSRTIQHTTVLLNDRFMLPERLPRRKIRTLQELKEYLPEDIDLNNILADATEQSILRPQDERRRKPYHSGKQRDFTEKTQIATTRKGFIVHVSRSVGGRMHDYKLFRRSGLPEKIPKGTRLYGDAAYGGARKDYPHLSVVVPHRRSKKHQVLTRVEKRFNKTQRRVRIRVEHTIAQLKKYRILNHTYRHSLHNYNTTFRFVANLLNFRMLSRGLA